MNRLKTELQPSQHPQAVHHVEIPSLKSGKDN